MTRFADLDRRFHSVSDDEGTEESAARSYLFGTLAFDEGLDWSELLKHRLVVILGEAGSGKTTEIRLQVEQLRGQSEKAFLIRLDRLVSEPLLAVLGDRNSNAFRNWQQSHELGYFFLDSVDESKIRHPGDFVTALDRISDAIGIRNLHRARLFFTSRISEWRPVADLYEVRHRFDLGARSAPAEKAAGEHSTQDPMVVHLAPLDSSRVSRYVEWLGIDDPDEFVQELDQHHAWDFARRPLDVKRLVEYWLDHGQLGRLSEMIEHNLTSSFRESETRETLCPLTEEQAREGAETLAAAALLCRNQSFRVPDDEVSAAATALDARDCLPRTWSGAQRRALLTRGLFDGVTYGCIRFHHRSTVEYLCARWLGRRLRGGCPLYVLEGILFAEQRGRQILKPALAPVAAWLAIGSGPHNRMVRELLLRVQPGVHLRYGDPEGLPSDYKRSVLHALSGRYLGHPRSWLDYDCLALARLADSSLASDVSSLISDRRLPADFRGDMLQLARYGRLTECLETALGIVLDTTEEVSTRAYAAAALRDCADGRILARLAVSVSALPRLEEDLCGILCEALYPKTISAHELGNLLLRTTGRRHRLTGLPWTLRRHLERNLTPDQARSLIEVFLNLLTAPPHSAGHPGAEPISERFGWLCALLPTVLLRLLYDPVAAASAVNLVVQAIRTLDEHWRSFDHYEPEERERLCSALNKHPAIRRQYLWREVERFRSSRSREPSYLLDVVGLSDFVRFEASDMYWLASDAGSSDRTEDRALALGFALDLWQPHHMQCRSWLHVFRIYLSLKGQHNLFWKGTWRRLTWPIRVLWVRNFQQTLSSKHWQRRQWRRFRAAASFIREQYVLHRYWHRLYSGRQVNWLGCLLREARSEEGVSRWAAVDWTRAKRKRGQLIAWICRRGCEVSWPRHTPLLPHEKTHPTKTGFDTLVGLNGLQSLWQARKIDFSALSGQDAERAVRYAVSELNGFADWLPELADARPRSVQQVFRICIHGEWEARPDPDHHPEVLSDLASHGERYWPLVAEDLLERLQAGDPEVPESWRLSS